MRGRLGIAVLFVMGLGVALWLGRTPDMSLDVCSATEQATAPSGRTIELCETMLEQQPSGATWAIVRLVDAALPDVTLDTDHADHDWACQQWGLPVVAQSPSATQIIVQIMQTPFPRGEAAPGISQSIEAYSVENGTCIWELF